MRRPFFYISTLIAAWGANAAVIGARGDSAQPPIRNIFTFPMNRFIENIAVRPNSKLLVTSMSVPDLFSIDPTVATPNASIVYTFANSSGLMGITEVTSDVFALVSGTWDLANTRAELGSLQVWTIDFNKRPSPAVKLITTIANSTIFNGLVRHPTNPRLLLAADSAIGAVYRVDLTTGAYGIAFSSPLLAPVENPLGTNLGINGLTAYGSYVYFTNSGQRFFGRVAVDSNGNQVGAIEVLSNSTAAGANVVYDDIALDIKNGKVQSAWIASHPSEAVQVKLDGSQRVVNDTEKLLNPTSAAFGRGSARQEKTLYVTNGGEFVGSDLVNEGVVAIDLS
jgi:hypothetical protein